MSSFKHNKNRITIPRYYQTNPQYRRQLQTIHHNKNLSQSINKQSLENLVDFATTACNRPLILEKTYESLAKRIKGIQLSECRLFLNIDPMPDCIDIEDNIKLRKIFWGSYCKYNR